MAMQTTNDFQKGHWQSNLCGICDGGCGNCCYAWFCPMCAAAQGRTKYDGSNCCFNLCCVCLAGNYNVVREGHGIEGSCLGDMLTTCCCPVCSASQLLNQPAGNHQKKVGTGQWSHGLCDITAAGVGICLASLICTQCVAASARTNFDSSNWCFNCCCLTPCANYNIVREGSGIEGSWIGDVLKSCCFPCCATIQMYSQTQH